MQIIHGDKLPFVWWNLVKIEKFHVDLSLVQNKKKMGRGEFNPSVWAYKSIQKVFQWQGILRAWDLHRSPSFEQWPNGVNPWFLLGLPDHSSEVLRQYHWMPKAMPSPSPFPFSGWDCLWRWTPWHIRLQWEDQIWKSVQWHILHVQM